MNEYDITFDAMGSEMRILIGEPTDGGLAPQEAGERAREFIHEFDRTLSRFQPDSELSLLNRDPRVEVPASYLMRSAIKAGLWAAEFTGGLVDPTLVDEIEVAGYRESRAGMHGVPMSDALRTAPARHPAHPSGSHAWESFKVDDHAKVVRRPAGLKFDTGGTGKGLAADMIAGSLGGYSRFLISCGGDMRIGGSDARVTPYEVAVEHPISGRRAHVFRLGSGGVATSGVNVRAWRRTDGSTAHHLLDPSTGEPCWSGIVGVTALGPNAVEAETLAKAALLSGPGSARKVLEKSGGLIVHEDGRVELVGRMTISTRMPVRPASVGAAA